MQNDLLEFSSIHGNMWCDENFYQVLKNKMTRFDDVNEKNYGKIKRKLKKSFKTIPCLSNNRSMIETFDIILTNSKLPITYFKTKTLEIKEDSSKDSTKILELIRGILNIT